MFTVPGGRISFTSSANRKIPTLACSGGLITTVLPAASAAPSLLLAIAIGMLNGTMAATTP